MTKLFLRQCKRMDAQLRRLCSSELCEQLKMYAQLRRLAFPIRCRRIHKRTQIKYRNRYNKQQRNNARLIRTQVFDHYGNECRRCGIDDSRVLSIDHVNGGGTKHLHQIGSGSGFYRWLVKQGFPKGFQTLCMNCQFIKRHEKKETR